MPRCKATMIVDDPFGSELGLLVCDLDEGHAEGYHKDKLNKVRWVEDDDEEPAMVIALPLPPHGTISERCIPEITGYRRRVEDVLARAAKPAASVPAITANTG